MKTIAIYHNKGGVGKTTTVINLAAALSKQRKRVLVIDLDSQANTTFATGLVKFQDELNDTIKDNYVYHVIAERNKFSLREVARRSNFTTPPFEVIPSHINLMEHEQELIQVAAALTRLPRKLKDAENDYDIVLIDTPPSLNLYARIALVSADYLIIPSDLRPFANEGLRNVWRFVSDVNEVRESMGMNALEILGVLPSKVNTSPKFVEHTLPDMESMVSAQYGFSLLKSKIFERRDTSAAVEQTIDLGNLEIPNPISVLDYKPNSQAAGEFEELAEEVLRLIHS
jgi:cellulose biosynthesis protein BcsQ